MLASQIVWLKLSRRIGKRASLLLALAIQVSVSATWLLASAADPVWLVYARALCQGFGLGGVMLMGQSLLPDVMEYDWLRSGLRREGLLSALYATTEKVAQAIGVALIGVILGSVGYISGGDGRTVQPQAALAAIQLSVALIPAVLGGGAFLLMLFFRLTEQQLDALRAARGSGPTS